MLKSFTELLRELRTRAKLTQKELSKVIGVDNSYLSRVERGVYPPPTRDIVVAIADAVEATEVERLFLLLTAGRASIEDFNDAVLHTILDHIYPEITVPKKISTAQIDSQSEMGTVIQQLGRSGRETSSLRSVEELTKSGERVLVPLDRLSTTSEESTLELETYIRNLMRMANFSEAEKQVIEGRIAIVAQQVIGAAVDGRQLLPEDSGYSDTRYVVTAVEDFLRGGTLQKQTRDSEDASLDETARRFSDPLMWATVRVLMDGSLDDTPELPAGQEILHGAEKIAETAIRLVRAASPLHQGQNAILLTFQGEQDIFAQVPHMRPEWERALQDRVRIGTEILHLIRLNRNLQRALGIVKHSLSFTGFRGKYIPYYFDQYGTLAPVRDFLIVPEAGALDMFSITQNKYVDAAVFHPPSEQLELYLAHLRQMQDKTEPLYRIYNLLSNEYDAVVARCEAKGGDKFVVKNGLNVILTPPELEDELAQHVLAKGNKNAEILIRGLAYRTKRRESFKNHITQWRYQEIRLKQAIEDFVERGELPREDWLRQFGVERLTPSQCAQLLEYVIELLQNNDNYDLALLDKPEEWMMRTYLVIKGGSTVLLEDWSSETNPQAIEITEPILVQAFQEHFQKLWRRLPPYTKDKNQVIAWLQQQVSDLRKYS